jgi:tetratricopeptide (TPR) repeat protein
VTATGPPAVAESALDELLGLIAAEARAGDAKRRGADLRVRAALLSWDAHGDGEEALKFVEKLDHPIVSSLRLQNALEKSDEKLLHACVAEAKKRNDKQELADLGGLLLWRIPQASEAAELLRLAGEDAPLARRLALAISGDWGELVETLAESKAGKDGDPEVLVEAAAIAQDRLADPARARSLLLRAFDRAGKAPQAPYVIERLLELSDEKAVEGHRARLLAVGDEPALAAERQATLYLLSVAYERAGAEAEAAVQISLLCDKPQDPGYGELLAWRAKARLEAARGEFARAADAWEKLAALAEATQGASGWWKAYLRRAAEMWDSRVNDPARAEVLFGRLHAAAPDDAESSLALVRLRLLRGAVAEAAQVLEAHGRAVLRTLPHQGARALALAARAAEMHEEARGSDREPAQQVQWLIARWREATSVEADRASLESLARAYRRAADRKNLVEVYKRLGGLVDARRAAAYFAAAGALYLDLGDVREADGAFSAAADREPDDLVLHAGRVVLYRRAGKNAEEAQALNSLIGSVRAADAKARLYRQLAMLASDRLKDNALAQQSYEKALELSPDDVTTLHAFAQLCGETGKWQRAVELREQAIQKAPETRSAGILVEIGEIYEKRLNDDEKARNALQRALEKDARCLPALVQLAALHRRHKRTAELVDVLKKQIALAGSRDTQLELQIELAHAAEPDGDKQGADVEVALGAYRDALRIDPAQQNALTGLEKLCRRENRWEVLADCFKRAPQTIKNVRALSEALERLERWEELAEAREVELSLQSDGKEIARTARLLAELYEKRLNDLDAAARAWHRVDESDPRDPQASRALQRIYDQRSRYADLAAAVERELAIYGDVHGEAERRLELWLKLGDIRRTRLSRPDAAAEAFEKALEVDATSGEALAALAEIYAASKRSDDLNRVLDLRAAATTDPQQRAQVLQQKGDLLERNGDLDGALNAYAESFKLDAANRTCFTAYERVCYRRERWRQAMELYDAAIRLVEVNRSRAYRLADLYARRGQLQLQYLGQPGEAAASYLRVLELDPESDTAQTALERIFSAQADWQGLIGAYERRSELVKDDGKRVEILRRAARVAAAKLKDAVEAARLYQKLHSVDPTDAEGLDALERHFERTREWEKLVGVLTTRLSLTAGGDEAIALYLRIAQMCEEGLRDADRAIEAYRKILDIAPSQKEAIEALGRLYEGTEKWAELVEVTRRQIRIVNDRAQKALLYFKCGSVMESKFGKEDDAIRYYDAAIKTSPSCLPAVHGLRDLYLRKEDWPRVIQTLELEAKLWTEDKERAGVFAHIGQIYGEKLGDHDRAIQYYESALTVDRECLPANRALFELYFARQEYQRALPIAVILTQKVTREGDPVERSEFYRKRAVVAAETGDRRAAAESLVVALEIRPENLEALDLLVALCRGAAEAYDFVATFRELEKLYRKRELSQALARVLTAQAVLRERAFDIEGSEQQYLEALKLAPDEYLVVDALVSLHEKLRRFDAGAVVLEAFISRAQGPQMLPSRSAARYRLAEIYGDGAMDPKRAAITLEELIEEDPEHREAHFRLAQELYLLGRYSEAHRACERLIQLAAQPGRTVPPEELARYYDYLGRIAEASGDAAAAGRAYRRAIDLDPAYAPSCLALARRAAAAGDRAHAQEILDEGLRAGEARGTEAELPLRRGQARFYVALGDVARAVDSYRAVLTRMPDSHDDRVAVAELLAAAPQSLGAAREELMLVLGSDLRHVPAYRLLMLVYQRAGELERASRVATMLQLLGYAEPGDRMPTFRAVVKRGMLSDDLRRQRLLPPPVLGAYTEALVAVRETLDEIYGIPQAGQLAGAVPVAQINDPGFKVCVVDAQRLFGVSADVFIAGAVPGGVLLVDQPRPTVYLQASLIEQPDGERRFLLGRCFEPLRGGYGIINRLRTSAQRAEVGHLLDQIIKPESEREPQAQEFVRALPRKAAKMLERLQGLAPGASADGWFAALGQAADRAGLLACDDVGASARMLARLGGEELPPDGVIALGQIQGVAELVRFYLSDAYHELRSTLGDPTGRL